MFIDMFRKANIAELKNRLSEFLEMVEKGDEILVCKRNLPVAKITSLTPRKNRSQPGWDRGRIEILGPLTGPAIPEEDWNMLQGGPDVLK